MIDRYNIPGSKWLYFKIYTGYKTSDRILSKYIKNILRYLEDNALIEKWFYIRYMDPDYHIRIRLLLVDNTKNGDVISLFYKKFNPLIKKRMVRKIQIDTYIREMERYHNCIELSETIFYIDSKCMLSVIRSILISGNEEYRWMVSFLLIDSFLTCFSYDLYLKKNIMGYLRESFRKEFGFNDYNSKQFNDKYRESKQKIELVLKRKIQDIDFLNFFYYVDIRDENLSLLVKDIKLLKYINRTDVDDLISSYMHMMINRLFSSKNRLHELVIYDFLYRYYKSEIARLKY